MDLIKIEEIPVRKANGNLTENMAQLIDYVEYDVIIAKLTEDDKSLQHCINVIKSYKETNNVNFIIT